MRLFFGFLLAVAAIGCGASQYGFAREYEPASDEEDLLESEQQVSYEDVRRDPADYRASRLGWFGVVTRVSGEGSEVAVSVTHRTHQQRHLCEDETSGSCRVTVSERAGGPFTFLTTLHPEDRSGRDRLAPGSLVKVYGAPTGDFDEEGGPILRATYYRHWPRGTYVTTGAAGNMRR